MWVKQRIIHYMSKKSQKKRDDDFLHVLLTDAAGVGLLILVPILGPIPGPGGIPLLVAGLGLLGKNHAWARKWMYYVKKHSDSVREIIFPEIKWIQWAWDFVALIVMGLGVWGNFVYEDHKLLKGLTIVVMAGASTLFMMNRNRLVKLDQWFRGGEDDRPKDKPKQ